MSSKELFRLAGLSKTFGATAALRDVGLRIGQGEVHALLGHNGSGKSTLIKILAGVYQPDERTTAHTDGIPFALGDHAAAHEAGLRFVHQDLGLVDSMDTVDNLALGGQYLRRRSGFIDRPACTRRARELVESIGYRIDVTMPVGRLSAAQRTGVAIARALQDLDGRTRMLVLDEPTAAMPATEADRLFEVVAHLAEQGLGILLVTHHLDEVFRVADVATVLRDGRVVATRPVEGLTEHGLVDLMVGDQLEQAEHARHDQHALTGPECLAVDALSADAVYDVSLTLARSEIVGVAGLDGSGRVELLEAISGNRRRSGAVRIRGARVAANRPHAARRAGLGYVPADRTRNSTFADFDVTANITAAGVREYLRAGLLSARAERREAEQWIDRLGINPPDPSARVDSLSGGNQQKAVVARWLARRPAVLLMVEPTQGVDVAARESIYAAVRLAARDSGVLIASSDSEELAAICDRVLVLRRGRIAAQLRGSELTAAAIDRLCLSAVEPEAAHA